MAPDAKPAKASKASKTDKSDKEDKSKVHKLALKGSAKLVAEFVSLFPPFTGLPLPIDGSELTHPCSFNTRYTPSSSNEVSIQQKTSPRTSSMILLTLSRDRQRLTTHPLQRQEIWSQHARFAFLISHPADTIIALSRQLSYPAKIPHELTACFPPPVSSDDQVRAYIKKIMSQLDRWMLRGKISKLVIVITDKDTGEHVERWQFDVEIFGRPSKSKSSKTSSSKSSSSSSKPTDQENASPATAEDATPEKTEQEIQSEIAAIFRQITASVTFLPQLNGDCTFNVLVYADADSEVPVEWGDSDAKEIVNGERVQLRGFSTSNHRVDTLVSYRLAE
ncbi:HORMA domain-containing protein [Colletotrichum acutatum]